MYKVFINEKTIYFIDLINFKPSNCVSVVFQNKIQILEVLYHFERAESKELQIILPSNISFERFLSNFKMIVAAGGLVRNKKNEYLLIHRLGHWDLPKGKIEAGEEIEVTAIREVEEECSVFQLKIIQELIPTYHFYRIKNELTLKKAYWYEMTTESEEVPKPQLIEYIDKAEWCNVSQLSENLKNAYVSIKDLFKYYADLKNINID